MNPSELQFKLSNDWIYASKSDPTRSIDAVATAKDENGIEYFMGAYSGCPHREMVSDPDVELKSTQEWIQKAEEAMTTQVKEITEGDWYEMLEALPPGDWVRDDFGNQSFYMTEFWSLSVTCHYVRLGKDKYYSFRSPVLSHRDRIAYVHKSLKG